MAAWDGHDAEGFANLFADKFAVNDVAMPEPITTNDGVRQYAQVVEFNSYSDIAGMMMQLGLMPQM